MKIITHKISLVSQPGPSFEDLTERVEDFLRESRVREGYVVLFSRHTTTALVMQPLEAGLLADLQRQVAKLASPDAYYQHDDMAIRTENEPNPAELNGHAHCQALALRCSLQVPVVDGQLELGPKQRMLFMELDQGRAREVSVQIVSLGAATRH